MFDGIFLLHQNFHKTMHELRSYRNFVKNQEIKRKKEKEKRLRREGKLRKCIEMK